MKIIYILTYLITAINTYSVSHYRNNIKSKSSILLSASNKLTNLISFNEIPYEEDDNDLIGMEALQSNTIPKKLTINELKTTWENEKKRRKKSTFHLRNSIHNYYTDKIPIELIRDSDSNVDVSADNEVYLTEPELRRLWQESSFKSFGKPITQFNLAESLLLLPDDDEEDVMGDDTIFDIASDSAKPKSLSLDDAVVITDPYEYVITTEVSLCAPY